MPERESLFQFRRATFRYSLDDWHRGVDLDLLTLPHWAGYEPVSVVSEQPVETDGDEYLDVTIWFRRVICRT